MSSTDSLRIAFLGSGAFGLPVLRALKVHHEVPLVVSQPDRPAGRGRSETPTPISEFTLEGGGALLRVEDVNAPEVTEAFDAANINALVVIAFGQKLGEEVLRDTFAINLHASILPRWRGAAPINRSMMAGDATTGVSVIKLASRMDAGDIYATSTTTIDPGETAGELHDRLAQLGVEPVLEVLSAFEDGTVEAVEQDEALATAARKLSKREATVDFNVPADSARARIHGLTPWPGCDVLVAGDPLRILRVKLVSNEPNDLEPGVLQEEGVVACQRGLLQLLEVQAPGKGPMAWDAFARGRQFQPGLVLEPIPERTG